MGECGFMFVRNDETGLVSPGWDIGDNHNEEPSYCFKIKEALKHHVVVCIKIV